VLPKILKIMNWVLLKGCNKIGKLDLESFIGRLLQRMGFDYMVNLDFFGKEGEIWVNS
jgi:hypothetical protein